MEFREGLDLEGTLTISLGLDSGKDEDWVPIFKETNLITKSAKQSLLSYLYTSSLASDPITSLKVGTGGNVDPAGLYPKPEDPAQTNLIVPILSVSTSYSVDASNIAVTFLADVDQSTGNGIQLTECGLFKNSGAIFNVKNHPAILKSSQFSIHYSWVIKYL